MKNLLLCAVLICLLPLCSEAQIVAGSQEDKAFQQITAETNTDAKLQKLTDFEKSFPSSRVLPSVYLMVIDLYRERNDPDKIIEYGEKVLKIDDGNVTALMVVSRNYAMKRMNLDRAVELAQRAVDRIVKMRAGPAPGSYTEAQWKSYLDNTEGAARSILTYTQTVRGK